MKKREMLKFLALAIFVFSLMIAFLWAQNMQRANNPNKEMIESKKVENTIPGTNVKQKISLDNVQIIDNQRRIMARNMTMQRDMLNAYVNNLTIYMEHLKIVTKNKLTQLELRLQLIENVCENDQENYCEKEKIKEQIKIIKEEATNLSELLNSSSNYSLIINKYRELNQMTNNLTAKIKIMLLQKSKNANYSEIFGNRTRLMMHIMCKFKYMNGSNQLANSTIENYCINPCRVVIEQVREISDLVKIDPNNLTLKCNNDGTNCKLFYKNRYMYRGGTNTSDDGIELDLNQSNLSILSNNATNYLRYQVKCMAIINNMWKEQYGLQMPDNEKPIGKEMVQLRERLKIHRNDILREFNMSKNAKIILPKSS